MTRLANHIPLWSCRFLFSRFFKQIFKITGYLLARHRLCRTFIVPIELRDEPLTLTCANCFVNYRDFIVHYYGHVDRIIKYCQDHGVIKSECYCPHCNSKCRIDINKKAFRCDKSYVANKKKRKRCNFKVSICKGTWFDNSHIDFETNIIFCYIYLSDIFSYVCEI